MKTLSIRTRLILNIIFSMLIISLSLSTFFIVENYFHLKSDLERYNKDIVNQVKITIDNKLSNYKNILKQINSRTMLKEKLKEYYNNKSTLQELKEYSVPKLNDAVKEIYNLSYFLRINSKNEIVAEIGKKPNFKIDFISNKDFFISVPVSENNKYYIYSYSRIYTENKEFIGYDLMVLDIDEIKKIIFENGNNMILSSSNKIVLSNLESIKDLNENRYMNKKNYIIYTEKLENAIWEISLIKTKKDFYNHVMYDLINLIVIILLILAVGLISAFMMTKSLIGKIILNENELKYEIDLKTKKIQEEVKLKEKIYSVLAHDLRTPISGSISLIDYMLIEWKNISDDEKLKNIEKSKIQMFNQIELMDNILQWAKYYKNDLDIEKEKLELKIEIEDTIKLYMELFRLKNIKFTKKLEEGCYIEANVNMLRSIIRNIISNSIKYTQRNGNISLELKKINSEIIIEIIDSGIGLSEKELSELMKNEYNKSKIGTDSETGTGLGLGLIKNFAAKNNGEVFITSEKNKGTTVIIKFKN
jgi:signal transduction histidine kinase